MYISEIEGRDSERILALVTFLLGRAKDTDSEKRISTPSLIKLAQHMGLNLTVDQLIDVSQQPPLDTIIKSVSANEVLFRGAETQPTDTMNTDQAEKIVSQMAKRAAKKH
jgi:hypothetical protein